MTGRAVATHSYPELIGDLLDGVRASPAVAALDPFRRLRSEHYNVHSVPLRLGEVDDVAARYAGRNCFTDACVLDSACGFGAMALFLATDVGASSIVALDINIDHISVLEGVLARHHISSVHVARSSLNHIPARDNSFDVSVLYDCLFYGSIDLVHALAEQRRVLRPGGILLIKAANAWAPLMLPLSAPILRSVGRPAMDRLAAGAGRALGGNDLQLPSARRMQRLAVGAGFTRVRVYDRYRRADRGWYRYFFPDLIFAATKP